MWWPKSAGALCAASPLRASQVAPPLQLYRGREREYSRDTGRGNSREGGGGPGCVGPHARGTRKARRGGGGTRPGCGLGSRSPVRRLPGAPAGPARDFTNAACGAAPQGSSPPCGRAGSPPPSRFGARRTVGLPCPAPPVARTARSSLPRVARTARGRVGVPTARRPQGRWCAFLSEAARCRRVRQPTLSACDARLPLRLAPKLSLQRMRDRR